MSAVALLLLSACALPSVSESMPSPTPEQLHYLENELSMFMHFSVCTFNDACSGGSWGSQQNCGYGGSPVPYPAASFNPTDLSTDQWAQTAVDLGAKQVCLTTHHSGGFALWRSKATNYSIVNSPFGATGRDIVREFVDSMRKVGVEPCFYIVLNMDCAEHNRTVDEYFGIQRDMLTELLTDYGPITRMWWDMYGMSLGGAPWNSGGFPGLFGNLSAHAKALSPQTMLLPGPDGCLVGGETGSGSYPVYNFNEGPTEYACQSMQTPPAESPNLIFAPHEQDHTILNPGDMWWYDAGHPWLSAAELFETYLVTIGRGNTYILNLPPDTTGQIPAYYTNETFQLGRAVQASFSPESAQARLVNQTVECGSDATPLNLPPPSDGFAFDAVILEEDLSLGNQRISGYELQVCSTPVGGCSDAQWETLTGANQTISLGKTIGRKVIERGFSNVNGLTIIASQLRFKCTESFPAGVSTAYLRTFSAHKMIPPSGWPKPPFNCSAFNCECKTMADFYGVKKGGWGCAPSAAQRWWVNDARPCEQPGYSCCSAGDYTNKTPPFPGCGSDGA